MKIAICSSMFFAKDIMEVKCELEKIGHEVFMPKNTELYANGSLIAETRQESTKNKIRDNLLRKYFSIIESADAVLVINKEKNGIKNYVGGNSFLEMGFAHILNKPIYLLHEIPEMGYKDEIMAMSPIILMGDISKIYHQTA